MKQSNYVIVLVVLAVLNIYLGLAFLSGSSVINFLVGGYMAFRAYQEYKRIE